MKVFICNVTALLLVGLLIHGSESLTVYVEPEVIMQELFSTVINCTVEDSTGPFNYRWTWAEDPEFESFGQELVLSQATIEQAGIYTCNVQEQQSPYDTGSDNVQLIIHYAPRWNPNYDAKIASMEGVPADIICQVEALPAPEFFWQYQNVNLTSTGKYQITSQGNTSTLRINPVDSGDYGDYVCGSWNYVDSRAFPINLQVPGIPDSPRDCEHHNTSDRQSVVLCVPGFDGGDPQGLWFPVKKKQAAQDPVEVTSSFEIRQGVAVILVEELEPLTNYTLYVYQENVYGRSETSFGVTIRTLDGPPLETGMPIETIAIIAGVAGGVVVITVIIIVAVCCSKKRRKKDPNSSLRPMAPPSPSTNQRKKNVNNYVMDENSAVNNTVPPDRKPQGSSFRLKKQPRVTSGIQNPNYIADDGTSAPRQISGPMLDNSSASGSQFVNLEHFPGESSDTYDNLAYDRDEETSLDGSLTHEQILRRHHNSNIQAHRQSEDQPGLAGYGALSDLQRPDYIKVNHAPMLPPNRQLQQQPQTTPNVRKQVRLDLRPPSFEPEVPWEFPRERLFVRIKVGEGTFGEVWRAKAEGILGRPGMVPVAVKMLKEHYTPEEKRSLMKELEIMKMLQPHPNIVHLLGCCSSTDPLCIIMEYAANGNLQDLLRCQRTAFGINDLSQGDSNTSQQRNINLQLSDLKRFGLHVASGMEYVAARELLHRDLAARNILVDENMICKVADFGSARDVIQMRQYESKTQRRLPIRWMAPESLLHCVYTVHSDVWSYGVLLWEIITLGSSPYPGMNGPEVMEFVQKGCRMKKPRHCSNAMYAVMKDCWHQIPPKRPSFNILRHRLIAIMDEQHDSLFVDQMGDNAYDIVENMPGEKC